MVYKIQDYGMVPEPNFYPSFTLCLETFYLNSEILLIFIRKNEYKQHISCITEDEKYGKTGFKSALPKGAQKQQEWNKKVCSRYQYCNIVQPFSLLLFA